jgi:lysophospholipase L1-like esterase
MRLLLLGFPLLLVACSSSNAPADDGAVSSSAGANSGGESGSTSIPAGSAGSVSVGVAGAPAKGAGGSTGGSGGNETGGVIDAGTDSRAGSGGHAGRDSGGAGGNNAGSSGSGSIPLGDGGLVSTGHDCSTPGHPSPTVKIACVGDSITQGVGASASMSYPSQLAALLGSGYSVGNFGVSSTELLKNGDYSYWTHGKLSEAEAYLPNDVVIALGTNDMSNGAWTHISEFVGDYTSMINTFKSLASHPTVFAMLPPWIRQDTEVNGYTEARMAGEVIPFIEQAAQQSNVCVIDVHSLTKNHPEYYSDTLHPNDVGYAVIAKAVCGAILGGCKAK